MYHLTTSNAGVKDEWSFTSTPPMCLYFYSHIQLLKKKSCIVCVTTSLWFFVFFLCGFKTQTFALREQSTIGVF